MSPPAGHTLNVIPVQKYLLGIVLSPLWNLKSAHVRARLSFGSARSDPSGSDPLSSVWRDEVEGGGGLSAGILQELKFYPDLAASQKSCLREMLSDQMLEKGSRHLDVTISQ